MLIRQVMAKLVITVSPMFFLRTMPPQNRPRPGMVIISTMSMEVSIHAVSPEFGVQFSSTGGLAEPSQAGGVAAAAGAAAAAAGAAAGGAAGAASGGAR